MKGDHRARSFPTDRRAESVCSMNLALRDIRHNISRFSLTVVGIGMLLMIVMGMGGIYRGLTEEATLLVDRIGGDLWVVQHATRGPFAEISHPRKTLRIDCWLFPESRALMHS